MTKWSSWTDFDKEERKYIRKRDKEQCIVCGNRGALQIMHIFISRGHGGAGNRKNGCLGCIKCHQIIDNPIGTTQNELSKKYIEKCKSYLIEKENIEVNKEFLDSLVYKKVDNINIKLIEKKALGQCIKRCRDCKMLVKAKNNNSSIPSYYCKYRKININKTTNACKKYIEK